MPDRDNRPTISQPTSRAAKVHAASGWTALLAAIPAIIIAWQSGDKADSAQDAAKEQAKDVSEQGYDRDERFLRRAKRVMDRQDDDIDACFDQLDEVSLALEELYDHVNDEDSHKHVRRPNRRTAAAAMVEEKPDWKRPHRPSKARADLEQMPAKLEDL